MKVTQEKLPASQVGLQIEITPEMSKQAYEKAVKEFTRSANIPGFRKGKVPRQVLLQRLGTTRIKAAVVEDLIEDSLKKAIEQEQIDAIGNFQLQSSFEELVNQYEPGAALTFSAAVDVPPDVELEQYSGLQVKAEEVKYDPERVDTVLEDYRQRVATLVPVENRAAQTGDVAIVDFEGRFAQAEEGEEEPALIPGASAQDFQLELEEGRFIEGFIDGIIGMQPGETKEVLATFPESYPQEDVAGKDASFTVTLKELKERELPDLDDDFAQEISDFETLTELRESLEKRFREEAEDKTKQNKETALLEELVKHVNVEIPETLIKREVDFLVTQTAMRLENQGIDIKRILTQDLVQDMRSRSRDEAIARIKRTLALGEVAKRESIEVSSDELDTKVNELLEQYQDSSLDEDRVRRVMEDDLLQEKVLTWLEENGTVELVPEGSLQPETPESEEADESDAGNATVEVEAEAAEEAETTDATSPSEEDAEADEADETDTAEK